jgi:hypothetical protein
VLLLEKSGLSFVRVRVTLRLTVSQYGLASSQLFGRLTTYCFLLKSLGLEFVLSCPVSMGLPLWREARSVLCKSQYSHLSVCAFTIYVLSFTHLLYTYIYVHYVIHIIYTRPLLVSARYSSPRLHYSNYTWRRVKIMKLFVMQFSPFPCHLTSLRSEYPPQHSLFKHPGTRNVPACSLAP